ncbi:MAG: leucine-rich repeat protein [Butyrivibrio sp.]|nr:leucine-rich repeat protein [Butyrivibrio sp.]
MKIKTILAGVATVAAAAFLALGVTSITSHAEDKTFWYEDVKYIVESEGNGEDLGTVKACDVNDDAKSIHIYGMPKGENGTEYVTVGIYNSLFKNNKTIREVIISKVETDTIRSDTFSGCKNLKRVEIWGTKIKKIEKNAFKNCTSLEELHIKSSKITKTGIAKSSFDGVGDLTVYGPSKSKAKKYAKWIVNRGGAYDADYDVWDLD